MPQIEVVSRADEAMLDALSDLLADGVEGGASLGFMAPLDRQLALDWWRGVFEQAKASERLVLVAVEEERIVGCVQMAYSWKPNAIHRADVEKLLVHSSIRRRGIATQLMQALEQAARQLKKTLLILDTETGSAACAFYEGMGWQKIGTIPGHAYRPHGELGDTTFYYKHLTAPN